MNDFTKEEISVLKLLAKPMVSFSLILEQMNKKAQELGYESHDDFLTKTGWKERFCNNE